MAKYRVPSKRGSEQSMYWGFVYQNPSGESRNEHDQFEDVRSNPDQLSNETKFNPWHGLAEPDQANLHAYYRAIARGTLKKLTDRERTVWKKIFFEKMSMTEAARELNISLSTIRSSLKRAGTKIKKEILKEQRKPWM